MLKRAANARSMKSPWGRLLGSAAYTQSLMRATAGFRRVPA
jgi:hypothetical protein